jgi:hypothetical protein
MQEESGDFWDIPGDYKCIPTNAILRDGYAVLGKGISLQAAKKYQGLAGVLGKLIQEKGNHVYKIGNGLISFPTKWHFGRGSDIKLIKQSAEELVELLKSDPAKRIILTRPGCETGDLQWIRVKPIIQNILIDDKFIIVDNKRKKIIKKNHNKKL